MTARQNTVYVLIVGRADIDDVPLCAARLRQQYGAAPSDDDVFVLWKGQKFETGDPVGAYYQNKQLLKRVIVGPGDVMDIDGTDNVPPASP